MLIDYEVNEKGRYITRCEYIDGLIGGFACDRCKFNQGYIDGDDIKKVDCSHAQENMFFSPDEIDNIRQAYETIEDIHTKWLEEKDRAIMDRIEAFQQELIEKSSGKMVKPEKGLGKTKTIKIQCSTCYNHVKKVGDLCDFCLEKIRYSDEALKNEDNQAYQAALIRPSFETLERKVIAWGKRTGLNTGSTIEKQLLKGMEEFGELCGAVLKEKPEEIIDGFGDTLVTLILAHNHFRNKSGLPIASCLEVAYNEIKDRTGSLVNGNFVKDGE